jgi:hypothetical protein
VTWRATELRDGNWNGRQLVPRDWVRESTRAHTPVTEMNPVGRRAGPFGYGYLWWVWDGPHAAGPYRGAYSGLGAVGQHITVLPALDLVVAHKTAPGGAGSVSHPQYLEVLGLLVRAHCGVDCPRQQKTRTPQHGLITRPRAAACVSRAPAPQDAAGVAGARSTSRCPL